jgi:hypothetical protein
MKDDPRLWVQEHHSKVWHWYGCGHYAYSACGKPPIPGSPLVYHKAPDWETALICVGCEEFWKCSTSNLN